MKIILFDGDCNFCDRSVQFIIKRDKSKQFKFASLQSDKGKKLIQTFNVPENIDSVILIEKEQAFIKSSAALKIAFRLDGFWKLLYIFAIVPTPIRNAVYDLVAKKRHKFIKNNHCKIPIKEELDRFIPH